MKNKSKIIIITIIAIIIVVIIVLYRKYKKGADISTVIVPGSNSSSPLEINATFPLVYGSRGKEVAQVQRWVNNGYNPDNLAPLVIDGILGPKTRQGIISAGFSLPITKEFYDTRIDKKN